MSSSCGSRGSDRPPISRARRWPGARASAPAPTSTISVTERSAYLDALHLLARRELSVRQLRDRLADREHPLDEIDAAIARLLETRALDDERVANAFARTAVA